MMPLSDAHVTGTSSRDGSHYEACFPGLSAPSAHRTRVSGCHYHSSSLQSPVSSLQPYRRSPR